MATAYSSAVINAPVEQVWATARDFDGLPGWHPAIVSSSIGDGLHADQVGCVRTLSLNDGGRVREQLLRLDDQERVCVYTFLESPFAVRRYVSTMRFAPVTATGATFAEWWADFDADAADEAGLVSTFADGVFATGLSALASKLGGSMFH